MVAVSVADADGNLLMPCGRCRQMLIEIAGPELLVDHQPAPLRIESLLPEAFGASHLPKTGAE